MATSGVLHSVGEIDAFIDLLRAACSERQLHQQLQAVLRLPADKRQAAIHALVSDLVIAAAPQRLVQAIACLADDRVAEQAREVLLHGYGSTPDFDSLSQARRSAALLGCSVFGLASAGALLMTVVHYWGVGLRPPIEDVDLLFFPAVSATAAIPLAFVPYFARKPKASMGAWRHLIAGLGMSVVIGWSVLVGLLTFGPPHSCKIGQIPREGGVWHGAWERLRQGESGVLSDCQAAKAPDELAAYGVQLHNAGRFSESLKVLVEAKRQQKAVWPALRWQLGKTLYALGRYRDAVAAYTEALKPVDFTLGYWDRGLAYEALGDVVAARQDFERCAIRLNARRLASQPLVSAELEQWLPALRAKLGQYGLLDRYPL